MTQKSEVDERELFEAWAKARGGSVDRADSGEYRSAATEALWSGWLARAAVPKMTNHLYAGDCPDENQPDAFDPNCPACAAVPAHLVQQPTIPEGWKLVPVEPTEEMWTAGRDPIMFRDVKYHVPAEMEAPPWRINPATGEVERDKSKGTTAVHVWRAMVTAAPQAAQPMPDGDPAPPNNLPQWDECALRVSNSKFIAQRVAEGGYGAEPDSMLATELHRFIYEYDDADPYLSAWFLHRLELVLTEARTAGGAVRYVRKPEADRRISRGDDFAGDAWLDMHTGETVYTVVGFDRNQQPTMVVQDGRAVSTAGVALPREPKENDRA